MKRITTGLLAAAMGMALFAGCSSTPGGGTTTTPAPGDTSSSAATGGTIKIGLATEQSGAVASYSSDILKGVQYAVDEINGAGGINGQQIQLVSYDTQSDPAVATQMATKLATQDKVAAMIGPATSGSFMATIPVANANKVPVVSGSATADAATVDNAGNVQPFAFRTCVADSFQGSSAATFALNTLNAKTAVIYMDNSSDYAKGLAKTFNDSFTAGGGTIVDTQSYAAGDTDFNAVLTKIKSEQFDVLYLPGYYQEAGLIIKAARGMGISQPVMGDDGYDSPTLKELGGADALNSVYFTNHYSPLNQDPRVTQFVADWKAKNGTDPSGFNAMGYDTMKFIADAITRAGSTDGQSIADAMAATKDFPAVTGTLSVDPNTHNVIKSIVVIELKNGDQAAATTVAPAGS
ncbi:MAG: ABC transporter substrate-binding protein [Propionibacteriaceae bacterium]|nr:ABC transporter substrate-binding protein [Propionibacteriaceae bacterium]